MDLLIKNYKEKLDSEIKDQEFNLAEGHCSDYASYREKVGERGGLLIAQNLFKQVVIELHEEDNEDEN